MDLDINPSREVIPEYLKEGFDPGIRPSSELISILCGHGISIQKRTSKKNLIHLYEQYIKKNRKHLIHEILKLNNRGSSCRSPLGYNPKSEAHRKSTFEDKDNSNLQRCVNIFAQYKPKFIDTDTSTLSKINPKTENSSINPRFHPYHLSSIEDEERLGYESKLNKWDLNTKTCDYRTDLGDSPIGIGEFDANEEIRYTQKPKSKCVLDIDERLSAIELEYITPQSHNGNTYPEQDSDIYKMSPSRSNKDKVSKDSHIPAMLQGPVFDDEVSSEEESTDYSDYPSGTSHDNITGIGAIGNSIKARLMKIIPSGSVLHTSNNSQCSKCKPDRHFQKSRRFSRVLLLLSIPILFTILLWIDDFYKDYEYCAAGVAPEIDKYYSGLNIFRRRLNQCRKCPDHAVCSGRQIVLCSTSGYKLSSSLISRTIGSKYLPFFLAESRCERDYSELKGRMLINKMVNALSKITENVARTWVGEVECKTADPKVVALIKKSDGGKIHGIPFSLALERTKIIALSHGWTIEQFEKSWKEFIRRLVEPSSEGEHKDEVFDRLSLRMNSDNTYRFIVPSRSPILPTMCKIRKALWFLVRENTMTITSIICLVTCIWFVYDHYFTSWNHAKIVAAITEIIINSLSGGKKYSNCPIAELEQIFLPTIMPGSELRRFNKLCIDDPRTGLPQWIICNPEERELIWSRVISQVKKSPCIREVLVNNEGECQLYWKWTGLTLENTQFIPE